jgi:signal transduction histidine kinase
MSRRAVSIGTSAASVIALAAAGVMDLSSLYPWAIPTSICLVVALVVTLRAPSNVIGWLLLVFAFTSSLGIVLITTARGVDDPAVMGWLDAIGNTLTTAGVMALPLALLRFPEGKPLTPRWQLVDWLAIVASVIGAAAAFLNGGWGGDIGQAIGTAPFREATQPVGDLLSSVFYMVMLVTMLLAGVSLILRFRRATGDERLKMKWLAYSGGFLLTSFLAVVFSGDWEVSLSGGWSDLLIALAFGSIPAAVGIAILQYRLYDIDLVISRTVVLAVLAGFITGVYALVVVGLGRLLGGDSDGLLLPIAATAVVAVAFEPVRHLAQAWANRLVFGRRATPYEVLADLTERLSQGEQGEGILLRMASRLRDGTGAERATVWLGELGQLRPGATWPATAAPPAEVDPDADNVFPVTHDGVVVGAFEVIKPRGISFSSAERALIVDLAGSAGAVLGYQRLNDSLHAKATELARSRTRLVEAQDTERRRLERDLHDGAQQHIVALKVKLGLARTMAARQGAHDLETLLDGLEGETHAALEEVRALAKGIYPPVLESDGLGPAISSLAVGSPVEIVVECDGIVRYDQDVETAIYFEISEAVTNAVKHAVGPIRVHLAESEGLLRFSVSDPGPGFDLKKANGGSGLQNLRDRVESVGGEVEIETEPGSGTIVRGTVPLHAVSV